VDDDADGYTECQGDCQDSDIYIHPLAPDQCDGVDNDCDGTADGVDCYICTAGLTLTPPDSVQTAINGASAGDVICLEAGTYTEIIDYGGVDLAVVGLAGPLLTIIDGDAAGSVATFDDGETAAAILEGVALIDGSAPGGGGAAIVDSSPTLTNLIVSLNVAVGSDPNGAGGGVMISGAASPVVSSVTIAYNDGHGGGGLRVDDGATPTVSNVIFDSNTASGNGGGLYVFQAAGIYEDLLFVDNDATVHHGGGAFLTQLTAGLELRRATFDSNDALENGGGLAIRSSDPVLEVISLTNNQCGLQGGGLFMDDSAPIVDVLSATGNVAGETGGGLHLTQGVVNTWLNVTISGNTAALAGGGVYADGGSSPSLDTATVSNNDVTDDNGQGAGIYIANAANTTYLADVTLTGNELLGTGQGAGLYALSSELLLDSVTVSQNVISGVDGMGAGLALDGSDTLIDTVTLSNNSSPGGGGGAWLTGGSVVNCETANFVENLATGPGGVFALDGQASLILAGVLFDDNTGGDGGALYLAGQSSLTLDDAEAIFSEATGDGGVLYLGEQSMATVSDTHLEDNTSWASGGAVAVVGGSSLTVDGVVFDTNVATWDGGGVHCDSSTVQLDNVWFVDNTAAHSGGGMSAISSAASLDNGRFEANQALSSGGGLYLEAPTVDINITSFLFSENETVDANGGGVAVLDSSLNGTFVTLTNGTLYGNTAPSFVEGNGAGVYVEDSDLLLVNVDLNANDSEGTGGGLKLESGTATPSYSNSYGNDPNNYHGMSDPAGNDGNFSSDPDYVSAPTGDFHLQTLSPLIASGNPNAQYDDPDGGSNDIGMYGGPGADDWDLDRDGYPEWWRPGTYNAATSPGMDCDDFDDGTYPGSGC